MGIGEYIDLGMSYVQIGTSWTRNLIGNGVALVGIDERLGVMILMLALSVLFGHFLAKKYHTKPFAPGYILWTLIISLLFFIILVYV